LTRLAATAAAAALYGLLFPPYGAAWLSWLALLPLCLALRGARPLAAAGLAALFGWLTTLFIIAWLVPTLTGHFERPPLFAVVFWAAFSATALAPFYAVAFAGYARACDALPAALRPALFAASWVAAELARAQLGFRSPWAWLGDAHAGSANLRQIADLTGVYGVSALVALGNASLAELAARVRRRDRDTRERRAALRAAAAFAAILLVALGYGMLRRAAFADPEPGLRVAVVQGNEPAPLRWKRSAALRVLSRYGRLTQRELASGRAPDLVVWPENALQLSPEDPLYALALRQLAGRAPLLLGAPRVEEEGGSRRSFNSAWLLLPSGERAHYDKRRLLPFSETRPFGSAVELGRAGDLDPGVFSPGATPGLFRLGNDTLGVLICMEALYPELARELAAQGATLLVNLSNDGWYGGRGGAEQHIAQVVFRAVETRLPLVRSTTTGVSAIVDASGERVAELEAGRAGVLARALPRPPGGASLYVRVGDLFAWLCAACWAAALGFGLRSGHVASTRG
jgi:apolipoprotein N-acyltransferase